MCECRLKNLNSLLGVLSNGRWDWTSNMEPQILVIETKSLGDRSYLIHDGKTAAIIDPQRDIDRVNELLIKHDLTLGAVLETHIHNDYISGGLELSRQHATPYLINKEDSVAFNSRGITPLEEIVIGTFALKMRATPGHTFTHMAYQLLNAGGSTIGIFTGGSLLHGTTGRPDLLGQEHARELAGLQHDSVRSLAELLSDEVNIYPTHGFGSFCSATPSISESSTIGDEKFVNPSFLQDRIEYVDSILNTLDRFPDYFKYMSAINASGPLPIDLSHLDSSNSQELLRAIDSGSWVIDLRSRALWSQEHVRGTISLGLDGSMASYAGWLVPHDNRLFLFSNRKEDIDLAQRELTRIGVDRPSGVFIGSTSEFSSPSTVRVATFSELPNAMAHSTIVILDVRQNLEYVKSHIQSAVHIPFYEVRERLNELSERDEIWVHCASGYRAASVLGLIESSGRTAVLINEDYEKAALVDGLKVICDLQP